MNNNNRKLGSIVILFGLLAILSSCASSSKVWTNTDCSEQVENKIDGFQNNDFESMQRMLASCELEKKKYIEDKLNIRRDRNLLRRDN